ncbi:CatB-related O-acetyltransferase [Methylobacterium currus]|uniref:CatB-related O-acetyltransferase n=1 Tax=Methylobacterium currus TaxID=2051553 RepID=UPI001E341C86|nr:CatB-related O-acetyltransferase [Methylobacterium currus]UHC19457.1 CatB-related O-acetyltransferase [Methylobacterium currus]
MDPMENSEINNTEITRGFWRFFHESGAVASEILSLLENGNIGGYDHPNERKWAIRDGKLCFMNESDEITVIFTETCIDNGSLLLKGVHLPDPSITLLLHKHLNRPTYSTTKAAFAKEIERYGWSIGDHTYGVPAVFEREEAKLHIGKFCSIAEGVKIALGNHRTDGLTTYPFQVLRNFWQNVPPEAIDHTSKGDVVIGHDVWIGADTFISSGVTIGDGAVIGARSIITRDVPPYAIVVDKGRVIRYRFSDDQIEKLKNLMWWNLPDEELDEILPVLLTGNVDDLSAAIKKNEVS